MLPSKTTDEPELTVSPECGTTITENPGSLPVKTRVKVNGSVIDAAAGSVTLTAPLVTSQKHCVVPGFTVAVPETVWTTAELPLDDETLVIK